MSPQKDMSSGAQKIADGLNNRSAQRPSQAKIIEEREKHIRMFLEEIAKLRASLVESQDLNLYHRDRISALESNNHAILLELKEKSIKYNEISDLLEAEKAKKKTAKKTRVYKKAKKNSDLGGSAKDPIKSAPKPVTYEKPENKA